MPCTARCLQDPSIADKAVMVAASNLQGLPASAPAFVKAFRAEMQQFLAWQLTQIPPEMLEA